MKNQKKEVDQNRTNEQIPAEAPQFSANKKAAPQSLLYAVFAVFFMLSGAFGFWLYQNKIAQPSPDQPPARQKAASPTLNPTTAAPTPEKLTEYETEVKANPQDEDKTDIYVQNLDTGEKEFVMTLKDVYRSHIHESEYHHGDLYVIKRVGYDGPTDNNWTDELWKYNQEGNGQKLFSSKGFFFLVSPDNTKIAVEESDQLLHLLKTNGEQITQYSSEDLDANPDDSAEMLTILEWSSNGRYLWGAYNFPTTPTSYYELDTESWETVKYDVSDLAIGGGRSLNPDTRKLVYSDYPIMFDVDSVERFKASKKEVALYLYDFVTEEKKEIASSAAKRFNPKWLDDNSIEYNDPEGDSRLIYHFDDGGGSGE